uniref:Pre-rRNA-processing protein TSR2 homolog n=1 Tax=Glossina brevipalpis TaxID=37001 RepID=A0A1A9X471_9MUSC
MAQADFQKNFRVIVEKIFNNWQNLRLAVEHGMGGRHGQQVALEIMDYMYKYCIGNENISEGELQLVLEELMDEEFDTICEDGSITEICRHLLRYKQMSLQGQYNEIEIELNKLPSGEEWLSPGAKATCIRVVNDSSSEDEATNTEDDMDIGMENESESQRAIKPQTCQKNEEFVESDPGWTTVRGRKK